MKHAAALAAVSIAGAGFFAVASAGAAGASPLHPGTALHPAKTHTSVNENCGDGSTRGNEWTCLEISQNPWFTRITDKVEHSTRTVQLCLHKNGLPDECTPFEVIAPGHTESATYPYQGPGHYCVVTYRLNSNGTHTLVDTGQCLTMG